MKCKYCETEFDDNIKTDKCPHCGHNPLVPNYKNISYKTSDLKTASESIVYTEEVDRKTIVGELFLLPILVLVIIIANVVRGTTRGDILFGSVSIIIITALFYCTLFSKVIEAVNTGKAKAKLVFSLPIFIYFIIIGILQNLMNRLGEFLIPSISSKNTAIVNLSLFGCDIVGFLIKVLIFLIFAISIYVYLTRKISIGDSIKICIILGIKNIGKFIILIVSFIPLLFLVCITFGILYIWKSFYIQVTSLILIEKVLQDAGI